MNIGFLNRKELIVMVVICLLVWCVVGSELVMLIWVMI